MILTLILTLGIVAIVLVLLGVKILFTKNGEFPNGHIGSSKAMKERGIKCAATQDREAQRK